MSKDEDNWWSTLTSSAKKQAKKFWSDYTNKMKNQKTKVNTNPLTFKANKPFKAITAKKKN